MPLIGSHILEGGGKRIRPLLLILSARASGYEGPADVLLASLIEWIHAATLLHDDVLDEADLRRETPTVRRIWGNRVSVSMGDYAYFHAVIGLIRLSNSALAPCLLHACQSMALGELMQLEQGADPKSESDLPGPNWSSVHVRLDRNQGGYSDAQETVHTRRGHPTSADGGARHRQRPGGARRLSEARHYRAKMRAQFLNGELFYTLKEAQILMERWRVHYNTVRPHSSLGGQPPVPETIQLAS